MEQYNLHFYRDRRIERPFSFSCQLSLDVFRSSTAHVPLMLFCGDLNIRMADYEGGMREHNPVGPAGEKKERGQKDERMFELLVIALVMHIT